MHSSSRTALSVGPLVFVFLAGLGACAPVGETQVSLRPIAVTELGPGWAGTSVNTVVFRGQGLLTWDGHQFGAYYSDKGELVVVDRSLDTGHVSRTVIVGEYGIRDAHNSISLGIDEGSYLHLAYSQHASPLRYRRSLMPMSVEAWSDEQPMTGIREESVTYPTFLMVPIDAGESSLLFVYRDGASGQGAACVKAYDSTRLTWQDVPECLFDGSGHRPWTSSPYWFNPALGPDGELHVFATWRTTSLGAEAGVMNLDLDYARSSDGGQTWHTSSGLAYALPITQVNAETVFAVAPGSGLMNQGGSAVDSQGRPHVVYYANDGAGIPQYQHLWYDGAEWHNSVVSRRDARFRLQGGGTLELPMSRPEVVIDSADIVYVIYRADTTGQRMVVQRLLPPHYELEEPARQLWPEDLAYAEPVVDKERWGEYGILSMLIQRNLQPPHDADAEMHAEPVYIVEWNLSGE